jgi:hypothetical protein
LKGREFSLRRAFFAAPFLVGAWFGQGQPNDKAEMWLARNAANGTFQVQFRSCTKGHALDQVETGRWSLVGDIETLQVLSVNGAPLAQAETYKVLSHEAGKQVYRYQATGFVYMSRRVDSNFELPSCEAIS